MYFSAKKIEFYSIIDVYPADTTMLSKRTCHGIAMDAQWMLKGCSMVAETILSTLSLISNTDDFPPADKKNVSFRNRV